MKKGNLIGSLNVVQVIPLETGFIEAQEDAVER